MSGRSRRANTYTAIRHAVIDIEAAWLSQIVAAIDAGWKDDISLSSISFFRQFGGEGQRSRTELDMAGTFFGQHD